MSARIADFAFRFRLPLCGVILLGFFVFLPKTNFTEIDNDLTMWVAKTDPVYVDYERFRTEFGGQRSLIVALRSERLFSPESLAFIRTVTADIERVAGGAGAEPGDGEHRSQRDEPVARRRRRHRGAAAPGGRARRGGCVPGS
jgi:hypothetical protein